MAWLCRQSQTFLRSSFSGQLPAFFAPDTREVLPACVYITPRLAHPGKLPIRDEGKMSSKTSDGGDRSICVFSHPQEPDIRRLKNVDRTTQHNHTSDMPTTPIGDTLLLKYGAADAQNLQASHAGLFDARSRASTLCQERAFLIAPTTFCADKLSICTPVARLGVRYCSIRCAPPCKYISSAKLRMPAMLWRPKTSRSHRFLPTL